MTKKQFDITYAIVSTIAVLAVLVIGLAKDASQSRARDTALPQTKAGCSTLVKTDSQEMFVKEAFDCDTAYRVYTFADIDAKNSWVEIAQEYGTVVIDNGYLWVKVEQ